ncbi:MAG: 50S ribosomal protein L10 [Acholeplasmataceae bacterium]
MLKPVIERKAELVEELSEKLKNAATVVAFNYPGLTVDRFTELRNQLREADCEVKVYKNNISRRASIAAGFDDLAGAFVGPKAIAMSSVDVVAPAKIVYEFAKTNTSITIEAGVIEGRVASVEEINALAQLPSREGMLTQLAVGLLNPVRELAIGLDMIEK